MGIDCRITLPPYVQVRDVTSVLGVLFGLKPQKRYHRGAGGSWYADVPGVEFEVYQNNPAYCQIMINSPMFPYTRYTSYFFEWDNKGNRGLNPSADTIWQVAGQRLVEIFGGEIDYNDCDSVDCDFRTGPNHLLIKRDDESHRVLQDIIMSLKPITQEELDEMSDARKAVEAADLERRMIDDRFAGERMKLEDAAVRDKTHGQEG